MDNYLALNKLQVGAGGATRSCFFMLDKDRHGRLERQQYKTVLFHAFFAENVAKI